MFGNKIGWGIAAAIAIIIVGGGYLLGVALDTLSPPTTFGKEPANFAAIQLPVDPKTVVPLDKTCSDPNLYKKAIEEFNAKPTAYEPFAYGGKGDPAEVAASPAVKYVMEAATCSNTPLFADKPDELITYKPDKPGLVAIQTLGKVLQNLGLSAQKAGNNAEAMRYYEAAFALGEKLYQERLIYAELLASFDLMSGSCSAMIGPAKATDNQALVDALEKFRTEYLDYDKTHIKPVARVITSIDQDVLERHVGDVFELAKNSKERMWKIEAIFKLGRYRWNAGRVGDQRGARRLARQIMADQAADPLVKDAAKLARDLSSEDYHQLH